MISAAALISASLVFQPVMSSMADKYVRFTSRRFSIAIYLVACAAAITLWFTAESTLSTALLYVVIGICLMSVIPFINSMAVELQYKNVGINYSACRGLGSGFYSVGAFISGTLIEKFSPVLIFPTTALIFFTASIASLSFRYTLKQGHPDNTAADTEHNAGVKDSSVRQPHNENTENAEAVDIFSFIKRNRLFMLTVIGYAFLIGSRSCICTYMIHITNRVGGGASAMGFALGLGAAAEVPAMLIAPVLIERFTLKKVFRLSTYSFLIRCVIIFFAKSMLALDIAMLLQFFECGLAIPCTVYYTAHQVDPSNQVKGQSVMHLTSNALFAALFMLLGGRIIDASDVSVMLFFVTISSLIGVIVIHISTRTLK